MDTTPIVENKQIRQSHGSDIEFDPGLRDVIGTNYFINSILSQDIKYKYWYVIPGLMRTSRSLRGKILTLLPDRFKQMLLILGTGRRKQVSNRIHFGIESFGNCREVLTKLYVTGVLSEYLQYCEAVVPVSEHWTQLAMFPLSAATNYEITEDIFSLLPSVDHDRFPTFSECGNMNSEPNRIFKITGVNRGNEKISTASSDGRICCISYYQDDTKLINEYYFDDDDNRHYDKCYMVDELPLRGTGLNIYINILWGIDYEDVATILRFYKMYATPAMPYLAGLKSTSVDVYGLVNLLYFCALFDLDLYIVWSSVGPRRPTGVGSGAHTAPKQNKTTGSTYKI